MKPTDTSEKGLESLIVDSLVNDAKYQRGESKDYDCEHGVDIAKLMKFLQSTQSDKVESLGIGAEGHQRAQFLHRLQGEITKHGIVHCLRSGIKHGAFHIDLFYASPSQRNVKAVELYESNIFSVTRQLHFSRNDSALSLDMAIFINGLPVITFELKNKLTKQTVEDAIEQYKRDRDEKELIFQFGRCVVHFAVDDHEVWMCTHLKGKASWFLPFNKGYNDGAGNPPNPNGLATDYLWKDIFKKSSLTDIIENYAQIVEEKDEKSGKKKRKQIFPRYHQLMVVKSLLANAQQVGVGKRYLIQHSAGSGKSNSIAWLAHQLISLNQDDRNIFDSVIVVTDRRVLDKQIRDTIKQFAQVAATVGHAENSGDLRKFLQSGKKVIITTVQKFPFILDEIGGENRAAKFAIIIDEAHSSQGGKTSAAMNRVLDEGGKYNDEEETVEDKINEIMQGRKMVTNASYFAFTATPKNRTLEIFGEPDPQPDGAVKHYPFHSYTMKQAIQEGFILDVLANYTPVESYYRITQTVKDDPLFDLNKAQKKIRRYVERHEHAIREKTEIMVDHFHEQVIGHGKIGGKARAMVVTGGINLAIQYFYAFKSYLKERKSPYEPIVAFSGDHDYAGSKVTEASLNGFPSSQIPDKIIEDPYRFLIVADKYQTGYDEPLLHTMYVDKGLSGIKAVQTLSRLNRAHPKKHDTFVLDFYNDAETIQRSFEPFYRTTILSNETDPNRLHDLTANLDGYQVYSQQQLDDLVKLYLSGADRDKLDPILDSCVVIYKDDLDEDAQVDFKGQAKAFIRAYAFLSAILPFSNASWEKLSIFLNFLVSKLPAPQEEDLSRGILQAIDIDSYRAEVRSSMRITLPDQDAEIEPVPTTGGGRIPEPEMEQLSNIVRAFNEQFGNVDWNDKDKIRQVIAEEIPAKVRADSAYQNAMKNNDKKTAKIEHDAALQRVMVEILSDQTELYKQFSDNPSFKKWLTETIFNATYQKAEGKSGESKLK